MSGFALREVQNIVTRKHTNGQRWQVSRTSVNSDGVVNTRVITRCIANASGEGVITVSQRLDYTRRDRNTPLAIGTNHTGVILPIQRYRYGAARFCQRGSTGNGLRLHRFGGIDNVIACNSIDCQRWRNRINING